MKYSNFFGEFGGRYVAEILRPSLDQLEEAFKEYIGTEEFIKEFDSLALNYTGRPTPLM